MNSNQNTKNEPSILHQNTTLNVNIDHTPDTNHINSSLIINNYSAKVTKTPDQNQINQNANSAIIITKIEEKKYQSYSIPFKSFINDKNDKNQIIAEPNILNNNSFLNISSNPFSKKINSEMNQKEYAINELNQKRIKDDNGIVNDFNNDIKKNKSQLIRNSINVIPKRSTEFSNELNNSVIRIKIYKSHVKPRRTDICNENQKNTNFITNVNNNENINNNCNNIDYIDEKLKYKLLIKRIALQLKRKTRPSTRGYFYVSIIKTDKYINRIKKIAKNMKNQKFPPTHGFFYSLIKKENEYKNLIKKIASQLKKRINFPKCKIIKIYEPYRLLIKRIADSLKRSIMKKEKPTPIIVEDVNNINNNNNNICNNVCTSNNNVNENVYDIQEMDNKMDIDIDTDKNNNGVRTENVGIKNVSTENKCLSPMNTNKNENVNANSNKINQNIINNNNNNSSYSFSKISDIQEDMPKSAEQQKINLMNYNNYNLNLNNINVTEIKKETEQINNNENIKTVQDTSAIPMKINSNFMANDLNQEINIENKEQNVQHAETPKEQKLNNNNKVKEKDVEMKSENIGSKKNEKNIKNNNNINFVPSSTKQNKKIYFNMSLFTKESLLEEDEQKKKKINNKSHNKNDVNVYFDNLNNNNVKKDVNINEQNIKDSLSLTDIKETKPNFIQKFQKFLEQEKIEIVDNFPVSLNENFKTYLQQSNFWYLIICYIFYLNNNLSLYSIIHLLEQYNIWTKEKDEDIFYSLKQKIVEYINNNYSNEIIKQFLFMNKLKDINQIFEKFENCKAKNGEKANKVYEYKEIKVDNINIINNGEYLKCNCDLCVNDEACVKKVCDLNKNKIHIVNDSFINITQLTPEEQMQNLIQKINNNNIFHNNEAIFFKGISKKKQNNIFSKSKTIIEENTNIEYNYLPKVNNEIKNVTTPNNIDNIDGNGNAADNNDNNTNEIINDKVIENAQATNEVIQEEKNNDNDVNDNIIEKDERKKNFKNISKMKPDHNQDNNTHNINEIEKENENDICMKSIKEEGNGDEKEMEKNEKEEEENNKEEDKNEKEKEKQKEEEDSDDEDNKSNKKEKKSRKGGKSRNNKNKKKKEITKIKNENIINEKENDKEINENDEKEDEKSCKKKRKVGGNNIKKKNKSKVVEDEERNELEEMLKEDGIENKKDDENICENNSDNSNSIRKKKKSPNKKKNKKH